MFKTVIGTIGTWASGCAVILFFGDLIGLVLYFFRGTKGK